MKFYFCLMCDICYVDYLLNIYFHYLFIIWRNTLNIILFYILAHSTFSEFRKSWYSIYTIVYYKCNIEYAKLYKPMMIICWSDILAIRLVIDTLYFCVITEFLFYCYSSETWYNSCWIFVKNLTKNKKLAENKKIERYKWMN